MGSFVLARLFIEELVGAGEDRVVGCGGWSAAAERSTNGVAPPPERRCSEARSSGGDASSPGSSQTPPSTSVAGRRTRRIGPPRSTATSTARTSIEARRFLTGVNLTGSPLARARQLLAMGQAGQVGADGRQIL